MTILLSNDDGINAEGLSYLARAIEQLSDIKVIAPDRNRSGASNSLTLSVPLRVDTRSNGWMSVQGTPTDCVHLAVTGLLTESIKMVISGINEGSNLGDDVWYSGTVAAAMEGRFLGLPAFAVSLAGRNGHCEHYATAAEVAKILAQHLMADPLPVGTMLNINVPDLPFSQLRGYEITRLGTRHRSEATIPELDPRQRPIYWIGPSGKEDDAGPGTDFHAIKNAKVSITPIRTDLTQYEAFEQVSKWVSGFKDR